MTFLRQAGWRVIAGSVLVIVSFGLFAYGYLARPQLAFDENLAYMAAAGWPFVDRESDYSAHLSLTFTAPLFPYQSRIVAITVPDSPIEVEVGGQVQTSVHWLTARCWVAVRLSAAQPGRYEFTRVRLDFADGRSQTCDIGRIVVDARRTRMIDLSAAGSLGDNSSLDLVPSLASLSVCNRAKRSLTLLAVEAGDYGQCAPGIRLAPGASAPTGLTIALPPATGRRRNVTIRPWLIVAEDGGPAQPAVGSAYASSLAAPSDDR
jgi:hypothetical protein